MGCKGGANGLVCGASVAEAEGEVMVAPHFGHGPDTPAISAGTVSKMPQVWQWKWMTLGAGFMWAEDVLPLTGTRVCSSAFDEEMEKQILTVSGPKLSRNIKQRNFDLSPFEVQGKP
jgi:hypothetical protein